MTTEINNKQDIIDSRDIIARIEELENDREALVDAMEDAQMQRDARKERLKSEGIPVDVKEEEDVIEWRHSELETWDNSDDAEELKTLLALQEEASSAPDWNYGEQLIRDSYFKDYAQELAEDTSEIDFSSLQWPLTCIDWEQAADELKMDYTMVEFDGIDYWIRM
jgi:hypothetical protein